MKRTIAPNPDLQGQDAAWSKAETDARVAEWAKVAAAWSEALSAVAKADARAAQEAQLRRMLGGAE